MCHKERSTHSLAIYKIIINWQLNNLFLSPEICYIQGLHLNALVQTLCASYVSYHGYSNASCEVWSITHQIAQGAYCVRLFFPQKWVNRDTDKFKNSINLSNSFNSKDHMDSKQSINRKSKKKLVIQKIQYFNVITLTIGLIRNITNYTMAGF